MEKLGAVRRYRREINMGGRGHRGTSTFPKTISVSLVLSNVK